VGNHVGLEVEGKGGKATQIKIQPRTYTAIIEYCIQHVSDTVFLNQYGRPISTQAVWRIVDKYVDKAGIKKKITLPTAYLCHLGHRRRGEAGASTDSGQA